MGLLVGVGGLRVVTKAGVSSEEGIVLPRGPQSILRDTDSRDVSVVVVARATH